MMNSEIVEDFDMTKRGPTSININQELWEEVKKTVIDLGITATDFLEEALREKLAKHKKTINLKHDIEYTIKHRRNN